MSSSTGAESNSVRDLRLASLGNRSKHSSIILIMLYSKARVRSEVKEGGGKAADKIQLKS